MIYKNKTKATQKLASASPSPSVLQKRLASAKESAAAPSGLKMKLARVEESAASPPVLQKKPASVDEEAESHADLQKKPASAHTEAAPHAGVRKKLARADEDPASQDESVVEDEEPDEASGESKLRMEYRAFVKAGNWNKLMKQGSFPDEFAGEYTVL